MLAVETCGMNYLCGLSFSGNDNDALNLAKTLPVGRRMFYKTYIKMMLLQSAVFAVIYAAGTAIGNISGVAVPILMQKVYANETAFSAAGSYLFIGCLVFWAFAVMSGIANRYSTVRRFMLLFGNIYCPMLYQAIYLVFLTLAQLSPAFLFIHQIFAIAGGAALCVMIAVFVLSVKRNRVKFVTK